MTTVIKDIATSFLRPTQATAGYREVLRKRTEWRRHTRAHGSSFDRRYVIPAVAGPAGAYYAIDHHHLARALYEEGVARLSIAVIADASRLSVPRFWDFLDERSWGHCFDAHGAPTPYAKMPETLAAMVDDPYRSLAGALRRSGGFTKDPRPCSEFVWADYLRAHISAQIVRDDFDAALAQALILARRPFVAPRGPDSRGFPLGIYPEFQADTHQAYRPRVFSNRSLSRCVTAESTSPQYRLAASSSSRSAV